MENQSDSTPDTEEGQATTPNSERRQWVKPAVERIPLNLASNDPNTTSNPIDTGTNSAAS